MKKKAPITSRKSSTSSAKRNQTIQAYLRTSLTRDDSRLYYQGSDITYRDLEKKNRTGTAILNGRQLTDMAKRGTREFRKAMSFTKDKWDFKKNEPKESGTSVDDVIEYVRERMYLKSVVSIDSDDDDDDVVNASKMNSIIKDEKGKKEESVAIDKSSTSVVKDREGSEEKVDDDGRKNEVDDDDVDKNDESKEDEDDKGDKKDKIGGKAKHTEAKSTKKNDKGNEGSNEDYEDDDDSTEDDEDDDDDEDEDSEEEDVVPNDYIFPSYMAYILWGPFAPKEKQLTLFLLGKYKHLHFYIIKLYTNFISIQHSFYYR